MTLQKAIITGGAGFIGSTLVRRLLKENYQVLVYDNFSTGSRNLLPEGVHNLEIIEGDILESERLGRIVGSFAPDILFHLAAIHYIPYCDKHPLETVRVNIEGTASILEACRNHPTTRLIFTSTAAVYPCQDSALSESVSPSPIDIYGISKFFAEELIEHYQRLFGVKSSIARLFNVYGPSETNPHVIPEISRQLVIGSTEIRIGNLEPKRDYVFVEDVANALYLLATSSVSLPSVVNIATRSEYSVFELLEHFRQVTVQDFEIIQDPDRVRPIERRHLCGDNSLLQSVLGWSPSTDLQYGLREVLKWTASTLALAEMKS